MTKLLKILSDDAVIHVDGISVPVEALVQEPGASRVVHAPSREGQNRLTNLKSDERLLTILNANYHDKYVDVYTHIDSWGKVCNAVQSLKDDIELPIKDVTTTKNHHILGTVPMARMRINYADPQECNAVIRDFIKEVRDRLNMRAAAHKDIRRWVEH